MAESLPQLESGMGFSIFRVMVNIFAYFAIVFLRRMSWLLLICSPLYVGGRMILP